jgi:quinol monooxygenase YgiN
VKVQAVGPSVVLKAKLGKEEELGSFLAGAQSLVAQEVGTIAWFAFRIDKQTFGILDTFGDEPDREAHLNGAVAAALLGRADELLAEHPDIRPVDIIAEKLPR